MAPVWADGFIPSHFPPISSAGVAGARSWTGLTYAQVEGFRPMVLDLHVPAAADGLVPLVVWVHGGGWTGGDRRYLPSNFVQNSVFEKLVAAGFAVATVDYRLLAEAGVVAEVHDCAAAVRYLRRYAGELGLDGDRIALWGESAGASLAGLVGYVAGTPAEQELLGSLGVADASAQVSALVLYYVAADLNLLAATTDPQQLSIINEHLDPAVLAAASPLSHVHPGAPATLLVHGDADSLVPIQHSRLLLAALQQAGVETKLSVIKDADHCFFPQPVDPILDDTVAWLATHLLG